MEEVEAVPVLHIVTCHTLGCENAECSIPVMADPVNLIVVCGPCSQTITDVVLAVDPI